MADGQHDVRERPARSDPTGPVDRSTLSGRTRRVLSRGGRGNPDILLVESDRGPVVVKDFAPRAAWLRRTIAPWLSRREERAYRRLAGLPCVPAVIGRLDAWALVLEYRPGTYLSRSLAGRVPEGFVAELESAVAAMHSRGVVHLDLRHRSNILAGEDGRPVLLDFASAILLDPETRRGRLGLALLGLVDRRALVKWRSRLAPGRPAAAAGQEASTTGGSEGSRGASRPM